MFIPVCIRAEISNFFFCKGPDCKYFRSYSLCSNSALSLSHESRHRLLYLCFKTHLFTKTGCWLDYSKGHNLSTATLQVFIFWLVGCIIFCILFLSFVFSFFLSLFFVCYYRVSLVAQMVKSLPAMQETWVGKIPLEKGMQPTPVFQPGEFHGLYIVHGVAKSQTWLSDFHFYFAIRSGIFLKKIIISRPLLLVYTNAINFISWSCVCPACFLILLVFLGRFDIIYR